MSQCIDWRHNGRRLVLPIVVLPPEPTSILTGVEASALVDTGSTTSAITPRIAKDLGLRQLGKRPLGSAPGLGQAERYLFRIGLRSPAKIPAFPFLFDEVSGFELSDSFQLDALIGMDILKQCDFSMSRNGACSLAFG
jgi:hypothetical protein